MMNVLIVLSAVVLFFFVFSGVVFGIKHSADGSLYWLFSVLRRFVPYNPYKNTHDYAVIRMRDFKAGLPARGKTPFVLNVRNFEIDLPGSRINVRLYHPQPGDVLPLIVYYHGGGWVLGGLDTHDVVCRHLALEVPAAVLSVDYRLAPEHRFPAAADDAWNALVWAKGHAAELGANPEKIAVMGDSSGGNLAAVTAQRARGNIQLCSQILLYPVTDLTHTESASYKKFGSGYFLSREIMERFISDYTPDKEYRLNPQASPLLADNLSGLAPAFVITSGFDVLRDEGEAYAAKMTSAGTSVLFERASGMVHGFITMGGIIPDARRYITKCARFAADSFT